MSVLLPLFYIIGGLFVGKYKPEVRSYLSRVLTKVLIPYVIVFNLATYQPGTGTVAITIFIFCVVMLGIGHLLWKDRLTPVLFSYLNIGWLGLPIAMAIFGDEASRIIIAAYIGSSIFGNVAAVLAMQTDAQWRSVLNRTLRSPPVIAVFVGLLMHFIAPALAEISIVEMLYPVAKLLMSVLGMCILGIWLYQSKITWVSLQKAIPITLTRALAGTCILLAFWWGLGKADLLPPQSMTALLLLPLLPPAANIVVLETFYLNSGESAQKIASSTLISLVILGVFALLYAIAPGVL